VFEVRTSSALKAALFVAILFEATGELEKERLHHNNNVNGV